MKKPRYRIRSLFAVATLACAPLALATSANASGPNLTITVSTWTALQNVINGLTGGNNIVTLGADITPSGNANSMKLATGTTVTLDLNGHTLTVNNSAQGAGTNPSVGLSAAIGVPSGANLIIDATGGGTLNVTGASAAPTTTGTSYWYLASAGIGGAGGVYYGSGGAYTTAESCGSLTINGGVIHATGGGPGTIPVSAGGSAPGIGGGGSVGGPGMGSATGNVGAGCAITFNGGVINAVGGSAGTMHSSAAAIGTGAKNTGDTTSAGSMTVGAAASSTPVPAGTGWADSNGAAGTAVTPVAANTPPANTFFSMNVTTGTASAPATAIISFSYPVTISNSDAAGGSSVQIVTSGTSPTLPTLAGYTFAGWRIGSASGSVFPNNGVVTGPMTLYASWTPNSGGGSGGSSSASSVTLTPGFQLGDPAPSAPITLSGSGLVPNSSWYADIRSTPVVFANGVANGSGVFTINSQLPSSILPGEHTITLYGTGPNGQLTKTLYITVSSTLRVTYMSFTQSESASLAATGTDPVLPLSLAALALLAGGAAIISRRAYHS